VALLHADDGSSQLPERTPAHVSASRQPTIRPVVDVRAPQIEARDAQLLHTATTVTSCDPIPHNRFRRDTSGCLLVREAQLRWRV